MTGAVAEPVTTETEVTEAGSQPVAVVVQEDSAGDSDDEEDRGDFHSPRGSLWDLDLDLRREQIEGADVSRLSITSRMILLVPDRRQENRERERETVTAQGISCHYFEQIKIY